MPEKKRVVVSIPRTAELLDVSTATLRRMVRRGELLPPIRLSSNRIVFLWDEIEEFLRTRGRAWLPPRPLKHSRSYYRGKGW